MQKIQRLNYTESNQRFSRCNARPRGQRPIHNNGFFSRDAIKEATRDGAPPIDLIDGNLLCDKLKEFKLGVETKLVEIESVEVNNDWFNQL